MVRAGLVPSAIHVTIPQQVSPKPVRAARINHLANFGATFFP
jgi:hypothetical protein